MKNLLTKFALVCLTITGMSYTQTLQAQCIVVDGQLKTPDGRDCVNSIITAVPFLRIVSDARSGAMGDVGIGLSADPNAMHFNQSKLVLADKPLGVSATYTPWLRSLGFCPWRGRWHRSHR